MGSREAEDDVSGDDTMKISGEVATRSAPLEIRPPGACKF